jgi:hypothetical protein
MQPRRVSVMDLNFSKVYCVLKAYFDESFDDSAMCVGGWLCLDYAWKHIEGKWLSRIEHERRIAIKHRHKPIERYHATDCANLKRGFAVKHGWTIERQIRFTKKLISIIGEADPQPVGIVIGMSLKELKLVRPDFNDRELKWWAYRFCMGECLDNIGKAMHAWFTHDTVSVIHEASDELNSAALEAFQDMKKSRRSYVHQFTTLGPGSWENFPALQPADMIAYEGFKLTTSRKRGEDNLRKSLEKVIGYGVKIRAGIFNAN